MSDVTLRALRDHGGSVFDRVAAGEVSSYRANGVGSPPLESERHRVTNESGAPSRARDRIDLLHEFVVELKAHAHR